MIVHSGEDPKNHVCDEGCLEAMGLELQNDIDQGNLFRAHRKALKIVGITGPILAEQILDGTAALWKR